MSDLADKVVLLWQVEGVAGRGAAQVHPGRGAAVVPGHQHGEGSDDDHQPLPHGIMGRRFRD